MANYQALYRAFRPQAFNEVVGQNYVVTTLQNAIKLHQISHAYLFSGPRGTGKTSIAKIFAKAINCLNHHDGEPCNQCQLCQAITEGSCTDVIEIDAASNNGVDEIRDIRDKVRFAPTEAQYKVYIIDEVHMLTTGAFNALLKTLEEPPSHVVFILATTEFHKIPATILSRCQRFDFKTINQQQIAQHLTTIAQLKNATVEAQAMQLLARVAEGGMRDALSLLDQTLALDAQQVTVENALTVTGTMGAELMTQLIAAILSQQTSQAIDCYHQFVQQGKDSRRLLIDLITVFRDLIYYKKMSQSDSYYVKSLIDNPIITEQLSIVSTDYLYQQIQLLTNTEEQMKFTNHLLIQMEILFVKMSELPLTMATINSSQDTTLIDNLQQQVQQLQQQIQQLMTQAPVTVAPTEPTTVVTNKAYKVPIHDVYAVLKHATKQDKQEIAAAWEQLIQQLSTDTTMKSYFSLISKSEIIAASQTHCVIGFSNDIHCEMVMKRQENTKQVEQMLANIVNKSIKIVGVTTAQWPQLRQQYLQEHHVVDTNKKENEPVDPLVQSVIDIVGEELVEIID